MSIKINTDQSRIDTEEREFAFNKRRSFGSEIEYADNRKAWFENPPKHVVADFPLHLDLELSSICNLHCPFCVTGTKEFKDKVPRKYMDFDLIKKLIDESALNNLYSLRLSWIGEPTLHPDFLDILRYAKSKGIHDVSMLTHGKKFSDRSFCEEVVDAGIDWITFSIDSIYDKYEAIRMPIKFSQIVDALKHLRQIREEKGSVKPAIKIQGVWSEMQQVIDDYMDIFTPISDLIYTNPLIEYLHDDDDLKGVHYKEDFTCYQPFQRLVIRSNADAVMCANDEYGEIITGNAQKQSIKEIWHGAAMNEVRRKHIENVGHLEIKACKFCHVPREQEAELYMVQGRQVMVDNYKPVDKKDK